MCTRLCGCVFPTMDLQSSSFFFLSAPVAFRRVALETPEWTSRGSNHHRQSVSAGKTNAIPTEPSGRLDLQSSSTSSEAARYIYILGWD